MRGDLADFINSIRYEKGFSQNTQGAYQTDLNQWLDFLEKEQIEKHDFEAELVYAFLSYPEFRTGKTGELQRRTQARKLSSLKAFYRFLEKKSRIEKNPLKTAKAARFKRSLPKPIKEQEMTRFLDADTVELYADNPAYAARDKALWEIMYSAGLRISEALSLTAENFSTDTGIPTEIKITGKGKKDRYVFLGASARAAIAEYLPYRLDILYKNQRTD